MEGLKIFDLLIGFPAASLPQLMRIKYVPFDFGVMFAIFLCSFRIFCTEFCAKKTGKILCFQGSFGSGLYRPVKRTI